MVEDASIRLDKQRWAPAFAIALTLQATWVLAYFWYLKVPDSVFCSDGSGWIGFFPECPPARFGATFVAFFGPVFGCVLAAIVPIHIARLVRNEWRNWAFLGCLPPLGAICMLLTLIFLLVLLG